MLGAVLFIALALQAPVAASSPGPVAQSRIALANYGDCLVSRRGEAVPALLDRPYDDRISKASRALNDDGCPFATPTMSFDQRLVRKFDGLQLRGVLYQALLRREPGRVAATSAAPALTQFPIGRYWPGSPAEHYRAVIEGGLCLIERDLAGTRRLVLSDIGSADEAQALQALAPHFGKCGLRGDARFAARGALAEIFYRAGQPAGVR